MSWRAAALLAIVGWGSFGFGAVYPWAFVPLFTACGIVGLAMLVRGRPSQSQRFLITVPLALVAAAIALQLVPLSDRALEWISPHTHLVLSQYDVGYAAALSENRSVSHALSIEPGATVRALGAFVALSLLLMGAAVSLTPGDARAITRGIAAIGAVIAFEGILQQSAAPGRIYGLWRPVQGGVHFGPFVNRNHFAGWMLMAIPLAIGELGERAAPVVRQMRQGWLATFKWVQSVDGNVTMLLCFGIVLMISALVLAMSRSGIALLIVTLVAWAQAMRRSHTRAIRTAFAMYLILAVAVGIVLVGPEALAFRFAGQDALTWGGRREPWSDALGVAGRFPLTGFGLNAYGTAMLFYQGSSASVHYSEAHNDYLQLLADGGALVAVPAGLAVLAVGAAIRQRIRKSHACERSYWLRVGAAIGLLAIALQEIVDFSLQIPGNAALFVVVCAVALHTDSPAIPTGARGSNCE